jgi:hypothetical protein
MPISPVSPETNRLDEMSASTRSVPSDNRTRNRPGRSVNTIAPSGANARSHGKLRPPTTVDTDSVGALGGGGGAGVGVSCGEPKNPASP